MRLIDADETIKELKRQRDQYEAHEWTNLRESLISDGYDFAITDVEHIPTVEAIPKDQYEARLKTDMVAILDKIRAEIGTVYEGLDGYDPDSLGRFLSEIDKILDNYKVETEDT